MAFMDRIAFENVSFRYDTAERDAVSHASFEIPRGKVVAVVGGTGSGQPTGILSGVMLAFAMSMDDFVISFFVTGSNVNPLPLVIYSSVKTGVSPQVNALCTLMLLFVFIVLGISLFRPARKKNMEVDQ